MNNTLMLTVASEINQAHAHAVHHAGTAIDFAKHAGELLLKVKGELPHGEFLPWLAVNCTVSDRQARRYMAAAQGRLMPIRAIKNDTVSDLAEAPKTDTVSDLTGGTTHATESPALRKLEDRLEENHQKLCNNAKILCHIRDKKLYTGAHETFSDYCLAKWDLDQQDMEVLLADAVLFELRHGRAAHWAAGGAI